MAWCLLLPGFVPPFSGHLRLVLRSRVSRSSGTAFGSLTLPWRLQSPVRNAHLTAFAAPLLSLSLPTSPFLLSGLTAAFLCLCRCRFSLVSPPLGLCGFLLHHHCHTPPPPSLLPALGLDAFWLRATFPGLLLLALRSRVSRSSGTAFGSLTLP